uniref:Mast cell immunoglobulin like receptor 1 n=1 Tax=Mus spicilegus TaxID=10103 RepID=A0A8C6HY35_MUSSI
MGDGDSPMCLSVVSFKGIRCWLDKLLLWALTISITLQNAAVDSTRVENNELPSPNLNSSMNVVRMGQNVSLSCSTKNTSVDITYSLFWGTKYLESKRRRGGAVDFHLRIFNANESGPYKCKVNVSNLMKYSQDFNFTMARGRHKTQTNGSQAVPAVVKDTGTVWRKARHEEGTTWERRLERTSPRVLEMRLHRTSCMSTPARLRQSNPRRYTMPLQSSRRRHPWKKKVVRMEKLITSTLNSPTEV